MILADKYYRVLSVKAEEPDAEGGRLNAVVRIALLPDCEVYRGHFPGKPVCPGVCNIETIKECLMLLTHETLYISAIKQCRLTAVATPATCPELDVTIAASPDGQAWTVTADISDEKKTYVAFKGRMEPYPPVGETK